MQSYLSYIGQSEVSLENRTFTFLPLWQNEEWTTKISNVKKLELMLFSLYCEVRSVGVSSGSILEGVNISRTRLHVF